MKKKIAVLIALLIIFLLISSSTFTIILTQKPEEKEEVSLNIIGNITLPTTPGGYFEPGLAYGIVYDSNDNKIFVLSGEYNITVIDPRIDKVIDNISLKGYIDNSFRYYYLPDFSYIDMVYDPINDYIYIAGGTRFVTVLNGHTDEVVDFINATPPGLYNNKWQNIKNWTTVGWTTEAIALDTENHCLYIGVMLFYRYSFMIAYRYPQIVIYNTSTNRIVGNLSGTSIVSKWLHISGSELWGSCFSSIVYDPDNNYIYAWLSGIGLVIINTTTNQITDFINFYNNTEAIVAYGQMIYVHDNGCLYIFDGGVVVFNTTTGNISYLFSPNIVFSAYSGVYDPYIKNIFTTDLAEGINQVINITTNSVVGVFAVGASPYMLFDPTNGYIYMLITDSNTILVVSLQSHNIENNNNAWLMYTSFGTLLVVIIIALIIFKKRKDIR